MELFANCWPEKYRPKTLNDIVLTPENRKYFEQIREKGECPNLMLSGPPGIGKTSNSHIIVKDILDCQYIYINASEENGIDTIRSKVINFAQTRSIDGKIKIVILDEADGLHGPSGGSGRTSAQQALRNVMEEYAGTTRFILTCNYPFKVIPALHSRCQEIDLTPPFEECVKHCIGILKKEKVKVPEEHKQKLFKLIKNIYPDLRKIINTLQKNVINNTLNIKKIESNLDFALAVFKNITSKKPIELIREHVIQNEIHFNNDYLQLLHDMHDIVFKTNMDSNIKRDMLIHLGIAMLNHEQVMDKEVNFFTTVLEITKLLD
jgi:DNA polymerase III delta prime subunit